MGACEPVYYLCCRGWCVVSLTVATVFSSVFVVLFAGARAVLPITFEMRGSVLVFMVGAPMVPLIQVRSASVDGLLCALVGLMVVVLVVGVNVLGIPEPKCMRYRVIQRMMPDDCFEEHEREHAVRARASAYVGK